MTCTFTTKDNAFFGMNLTYKKYITDQATKDEIAYAQQKYEQAIQQAYLFHSQLGVQNKIKEQEFNPYGY